MKIEQVNINKLNPADYNPRKLTDKQKTDYSYLYPAECRNIDK